jgi:hypothetical protein
VAKPLRRAAQRENARRHTAGDVAVTLAQTKDCVCNRGPGAPARLCKNAFYRSPTERDGGVGQ